MKHAAQRVANLLQQVTLEVANRVLEQQNFLACISQEFDKQILQHWHRLSQTQAYAQPAVAQERLGASYSQLDEEGSEEEGDDSQGDKFTAQTYNE